MPFVEGSASLSGVGSLSALANIDLIPRRRTIGEAQVQRLGQTPESFPVGLDIQTIAKFQKESFRRHYPPIIYEALVRDSTQNKLYNEQRTKSFRGQQKINAEVETRPSVQFLKKIGIDEVRDIIVKFSTFILDEMTIDIRPGDRITYDSHRYEVMSFHRMDPWYNFNVPFHLYVTCNRYREERL